ncbi:hypothetical protein C8R42DRAFT_762123 [Lentinula raphanica]|nr:hypothetical protein C8R42DRAFT_762123 [Lentinula raphanica]
MAYYDVLADVSNNLDFQDYPQAQELNVNDLYFAINTSDVLNSFFQPTEIPRLSDELSTVFHEELLQPSHIVHSDDQTTSLFELVTDSNNSVIGTAQNSEPELKPSPRTSQLKCTNSSSDANSNASPNSIADKESLVTVRPTRVNQPELREDTHVASFLEYQLGPVKWSLFVKPVFKKKQASKQEQSPSNIIDFLVKTEIIKEVLRKFLPPAYSEVDYAVHTWTHGSVVLTRVAVLALSGWSKVFFSYWTRRAESLALFSSSEDRLRIISSELQRHLNDLSNAHSPNCLDQTSHTNDDTVIQSVLQMTTRRLDAVLKEVKERTGLSTLKLRGKNSILDGYLVMKDRFLAYSIIRMAPSQAIPSVRTANDVQGNSSSSSNQTGSVGLPHRIHSSRQARRNARAPPGQNMFKLQHTVDPFADAGKAQNEFEFEWQSK